jgi:hypothetical protein
MPIKKELKNEKKSKKTKKNNVTSNNNKTNSNSNNEQNKKEIKKNKKAKTVKIVKEVKKINKSKEVKKNKNELNSIDTDVESNNELNSQEIDTELNNNSESFEKKLSNCLKKCNLFTEVENNKKYKSGFFKNEEEYQNSFDKIILFSKEITTTQKNNIDVVMFHTNNEDGLMAAYYIFKYFEDKKELIFIPTRPSSSNNMLNYRLKKYDHIMKDKNIIIVDLSFGKANYDYLSNLCKSIIIIDDHPRKNTLLDKYKNIDYFIGDDKHCASVYTYKFFNPKNNIPLDLIYIDNNDRKLQLPFINSTLYRYITVYNNFKIIHSPYLNIRFTSNADFKKLEELLNVSIEYKSLIGKLYDEVCNNIKAQVAVNAVKNIFCGHPVYILNYNDPVLYKMVSREMFTLAERNGDVIDFVVLYGWEFKSNAYKIFVSEKHSGRPPRYTNALNSILNKYGKFTTKSGKVTQYVLNFYYPHDKNHDIWDLIK